MDAIATITRSASAALISSVWQTAVLAVVVWLGLRFAPKTSAGGRFAIWSALFFASVLLPTASFFIGHDSSSAGTAAPGSAAFTLDTRWAFAIASLWAVLAGARLLNLARSAVRLHGLWRRSTPLATTPALDMILARPGARRAGLCDSTEIEQPCVIGFFAPRILVPSWLLESASAPELEQIVLHESAHLRRLDDWTNLLQKLAVALFPLNPVLIWVERRLCAERELACDEQVVEATHSPREYATCLTNLAEQRMARRSISGALSLGAWERRSQLAGRVESILSGNAHLGPVKTRALAASLLAVVAGGAIKLGSTAQLVSFSAPQPKVLAQRDSRMGAGPHYQDVLFHPKAMGAGVEGRSIVRDHSSVPGSIPSAASPMKHLSARPAVKQTRNAARPASAAESIIIVTRWQTTSGSQVTRIDQLVRITSAAPPAGWFVVQL